MRSFGLLKSFLTQISTAVINSGLFTSSCCQLSLWADADSQYPQGSPILAIIPNDFKSLGWDAGGGIEDTAMRGQIEFKIIVMNVLDFIQTDDNVITSTDHTLGIYEIVDNLIALLQMYDVCNGTDSFLMEPMRILNVGKPQRSEKHPEYVSVSLKFEATICQKIISV
jgi:hypothetical protein